MNKWIINFIRSVCLGLLVLSARAQQTVFNVPSADVLDKGKVYLEFDAAVSESAPSIAFTPRVAYGMGHNVEIGIEVPSLNAPNIGTIFIVPTIKWKFYENKNNGLALFVGDHLFLPARDHPSDAGNYLYLEAAKTFNSGTRIGFGAYDFSAHVVGTGNHAGVQASFEQPLNKRLEFATDWFSGNNKSGFVTPGFIYKITCCDLLWRIRDRQCQCNSRQSRSAVRDRVESGLSSGALMKTLHGATCVS